MRPFISVWIACLLAFGAGALHADELAIHDDDFGGTSLAPAWRWFHVEGGWPDKVKSFDVGTTTPGALNLQPYHSAWVRDLNAPFLFREIEGDFDVRARVRVRGAASAIPGGTWSLGGLMARIPPRQALGGWEPRRENWHFITTGVGHVAGESMTETKGTYNSNSSLKLRPFPGGWVELRLVRTGMVLVALARPEGGEWQVRDRFYRMDAPRTMQVGLIAYTTSPDIPDRREDPVAMNATVERDAAVDMHLDVDWIRFRRPRLEVPGDWYAQVSGHPLATLPDDELLRLLGD